jgi:hypothetical protein
MNWKNIHSCIDFVIVKIIEGVITIIIVGKTSARYLVGVIEHVIIANYLMT